MPCAHAALIALPGPCLRACIVPLHLAHMSTAAIGTLAMLCSVWQSLLQSCVMQAFLQDFQILQRHFTYGFVSSMKLLPLLCLLAHAINFGSLLHNPRHRIGISSHSAEKAAREQGLSPNNSRAPTAIYSSLSSDRSSINSAAAGMHLRSPYDASVWRQPEDSALDREAANGYDAQDAAYAFQQLKGIKQMLHKPEHQGYVKPGYETAPLSDKGYNGKDGYSTKDGYGQVQDQRYHTQADSYEEDEAGRLSVTKDRDPVSVLPSHLYSTDDEHSTQHLVSGSNSAQTQPNTSMQMSGKAASLHLPSISDIYAVIGEDQKALVTAQKPPNNVGQNGGSIHYQEYEPSNLALATSPFEGHIDAMVTSASKTAPRVSPNGGVPGQQAGAFRQQDAYMADAGFMQQINDGLTYGHAGNALCFPSHRLHFALCHMHFALYALPYVLCHMCCVLHASRQSVT